MHHLRDVLTLFFIQPLPVFFSAIGLGFMFTEVTLIQKFILFLGNPIYSLAVILAAVLQCAAVFYLIALIALRRFGQPVLQINK